MPATSHRTHGVNVPSLSAAQGEKSGWSRTDSSFFFACILNTYDEASRVFVIPLDVYLVSFGTRVRRAFLLQHMDSWCDSSGLSSAQRNQFLKRSGFRCRCCTHVRAWCFSRAFFLPTPTMVGSRHSSRYAVSRVSYVEVFQDLVYIHISLLKFAEILTIETTYPLDALTNGLVYPPL